MGMLKTLKTGRAVWATRVLVRRGSDEVCFKSKMVESFRFVKRRLPFCVGGNFTSTQ